MRLVLHVVAAILVVAAGVLVAQGFVADDLVPAYASLAASALAAVVLVVARRAG